MRILFAVGRGSAWLEAKLEKIIYALAKSTLKFDPKSEAIFDYGNKRRNRFKLLYLDGTGIWLLAGRLEAGTFSCT